MIRRIHLLFAGLFTAFIVGSASSVALAAFDPLAEVCENRSGATVCQEKDNKQTSTDNSLYGPNGIIVKIVNILAFVIGIAAVIVIIIAGIQYMVSTGDSTKVNNAKNAILYAIVGLVVAVLSRWVILFTIGKIFK
jgi:hypothetical protein